MSPYACLRSEKCHNITNCWCHSWVNAADAWYPKVSDPRHPFLFVSVTVSRLFTQPSVNLKFRVSNSSRAPSLPRPHPQVHRHRAATSDESSCKETKKKPQKKLVKQISLQIMKLFTEMGIWVATAKHPNCLCLHWNKKKQLNFW